MKKTLLRILLILFPAISMAQGYSMEDKALICGRIDTLLQAYLQKSGLTLPGVNKRNDKVVGDLRTMFTVDAEIFDDINASFNEKKDVSNYELKTKTRNSFIEDLVDEFPKGLIINNKKLNINYSNFDKGEITAVVERNVQGTNSQKFTFYNEDTLLLKISIQPDKSVKISNVKMIGSNIKCLNDDDIDGVINELDECPKEKGVIALKGCPDRDNDGIPDRKDDCPDFSGPASNGGCPPSTFAYQFVFSAGAGYQINNNIIKAQEGTIGYNGLEKSSSSVLPEIEHSGTDGSIVINANIAYYFGKSKANRNKGISIGFTATNYTGAYDIKNVKYVFTGQYADNGSYKRIITLKNGHEDLSFSILNFPIMMKYKTKLSSKLAAEIGAGISLVSFITNLKASSSATFDFEGIDEGLNWINVGDTINNHWFNPDANAYFDTLSSAGYDFALNKKIEPRTNTFNKFKLGYIASADLFYHITKKNAIKFGVSFAYSPSKEKNSGYEMTNATSEKYNSVYSSNIKTTYTALAFNVGIIIGLNVQKH